MKLHEYIKKNGLEDYIDSLDLIFMPSKTYMC